MRLSTHIFVLTLGGLTLLALGLRLWRLAALGGFDWDEAATVYIAARPIPDLLAYLRGAPFEHPPLYYLLAHAWLGLGRDESVLRALSALLGALAVPLVGLLGAALFDRRVGVIVAGLLAAAPAHLFYSRDARMYPLLTLLVLVAAYALVRATSAPEHTNGSSTPAWRQWRLQYSAPQAAGGHETRPYETAPVVVGPGAGSGRPAADEPTYPGVFGASWRTLWAAGGVGWWALWGAAGLAALATHYYAAFALAGQGLYLLWARRGDRRAWLALGGVGLLAAGVLAGWWALAPGLRHSLSGLGFAPLSPDDAAQSIWRASAGLLRGPFSEEPAPWEEAAGALGVALLALLAAGAWRRSPRGTRFLLAAGLAPLGGLVALMLVGRDLNVRFLLMLLPFALLALAAGWDALRPRGWALAAAGAAWAVVVVPWLIPYYRDYVRGDYALATREIEAAEQPGEVVVFNGPWQTLLFDHYYQGHLPAHILTGAVPLVERDVAAALGELAGRYQGFWLLETDMGHADPTGFVPRWLAQHAYRAEEADYQQVRLVHFLQGGATLHQDPVDYATASVTLERLGVEPDGPRPGRLARVELIWRVDEAPDPGLKAALRLRDAEGRARWAADRWLDEGWLGTAPPAAGDRLRLGAAIALPADAPAGPYTLEVVVYRSTAHPESGEGWVAWSAPPLLLPLAATGSREVAAAPNSHG
jgi:hypothetical protein